MTSNDLPDQPDDIATHTRARDGNGKYTRDPETVDRDAQAAELRKRGKSYRQIGEALGITKASAYEAVQRVFAETIREPGESLRALELERLDTELEKLEEMEQLVRDILEREHVTVSQGRVVYDDAGTAVRDDTIVLSCVDRLQRIADQRRKNGESRRKLLGMDQPPKVEVSGGITYQIVGIDPSDLT